MQEIFLIKKKDMCLNLFMRDCSLIIVISGAKMIEKPAREWDKKRRQNDKLLPFNGLFFVYIYFSFSRRFFLLFLLLLYLLKWRQRATSNSNSNKKNGPALCIYSYNFEDARDGLPCVPIWVPRATQIILEICGCACVFFFVVISSSTW